MRLNTRWARPGGAQPHIPRHCISRARVLSLTYLIPLMQALDLEVHSLEKHKKAVPLDSVPEEGGVPGAGPTGGASPGLPGAAGGLCGDGFGAASEAPF